MKDGWEGLEVVGGRCRSAPWRGEWGAGSERGGGRKRSPPGRFAVDLPFSRGGKERLRLDPESQKPLRTFQADSVSEVRWQTCSDCPGIKRSSFVSVPDSDHRLLITALSRSPACRADWRRRGAAGPRARRR